MERREHLEEAGAGELVFQCPACGLHYRDHSFAQKCEAWCREHQSCNLDIIKESLENKAAPPSS